MSSPERESTARRKGRRSWPPSLRGSSARTAGCPHVVFQLQKSAGDVWPRISSAHALPKERSGSSERGPSAERRSAGQTVDGRAGRRDHRASDSPAQVGRGSAQDPAWRESAMQRSLHRSLGRCSGRGTGAVTATGSREGSPVERRHSGSSLRRLGHARRPRVVSAFQRALRPAFRGQKPRSR